MTRHRWYKAACAGRGIAPLLPLLAGLNIAGAAAAELQQPPKCSALPGANAGPAPVCSVSAPGDLHGGRELRVRLDARTAPVRVGGYEVATETYNGTYLPPLLELAPGDRLAVELSDDLAPDEPAMGSDGTGPKVPDPTNLHTHGLIVSPDPVGGDNAFVLLHGHGDRHDYAITIPTDLPASLLRGDPGVHGGSRAHPSGLFWYHPHAHMYAAKQVGGGMSGLLAIGEEKASLVSDSDASTKALRDATDVRYLMLRDTQVRTDTESRAGRREHDRDWRRGARPATDLCGPRRDPSKRKSVDCPSRRGYCEPPTPSSGSRPTGSSPSTASATRPSRLPAGATRRCASPTSTRRCPTSLQLVPEADWEWGNVDSDLLPFAIVSVDGVPPGGPGRGGRAGPGSAQEGPRGFEVPLLTAARSEVLLRNDGAAAEQTRRYVLVSRHLDTGADYWPTVALAEVVLQGHPAAPTAQQPAAYLARLDVGTGASDEAAAPAVAALAVHGPDTRGCVRDIRRADREHRRLVLATNGVDDDEKLRIDSVIVRPRPARRSAVPYLDVQQDDATVIYGHPFEDYLDDQHNVVWRAGDGFHPKHICIDQSGGNAHGQVWEIVNQTDELHNFHLHQSKFHLSTPADFDRVGITTGDRDPAVVIDSPTDAGQSALELFGDLAAAPDSWHDTLPVPPHGRIFITVNLNAPQQRGQFVLHCHFLEHEDKGMMAPIEVFRELRLANSLASRCRRTLRRRRRARRATSPLTPLPVPKPRGPLAAGRSRANLRATPGGPLPCCTATSSTASGSRAAR